MNRKNGTRRHLSCSIALITSAVVLLGRQHSALAQSAEKPKAAEAAGQRGRVVQRRTFESIPDQWTFASTRTLVVPVFYPSIQSAIDAANAGDLVLVQPGKYRESITLKDGVSVFGAAPPIDFYSPSEQQESQARIERLDEAEDLIKHWSELGPRSWAATVEVPDGAEFVVIAEHCHSGSIGNLELVGRGTKTADEVSIGVFLVDSSVKIIGCQISGFTAGIAVFGLGATPTLTLNSCNRNKVGIQFASGASGLATSNKCFVNEVAGIAVRSEGTRPTLDKNQLYNNLQDGVLFDMASGGTASANDCWLNGQDGISVYGPKTAPTLKENRTRSNYRHGIQFQQGASGLAEGNKVEQNERGGIIVQGAGSDPTLKDNKVTENKLFGISFEGGAGGFASGNSCVGNHGGIGILGQNTSPTLTDNSCSANEFVGIAFFGGALGTAENNLCERSAVGICVFDQGTAPKLKGNRVLRNKNMGIYVRNGAHGVADGNTFEQNATDGIAVEGPGTAPTLKNNVVRANARHGIAFVKGAKGEGRGNQITNNGECGVILLGEGTAPHLVMNILENNKLDFPCGATIDRATIASPPTPVPVQDYVNYAGSMPDYGPVRSMFDSTMSNMMWTYTPPP